MTQSRTELIDIVGRILAGPEYWDDPRYHNDPNKDAYEVGELAKEIVTALRPEANDEPKAPVKLNDWHPDCGGDWVLSGPGYFANYWPDNTVSAVINDANGNELADSGIQSGISRAECQAFAERWIRERL